ncbi:MAG TPA: DUF4340 domain-containing protein [Acidimicrobiia bacterium]|nr:DUF4340 domain-containing protein [Acidimicrobiia bacterium]
MKLSHHVSSGGVRVVASSLCIAVAVVGAAAVSRSFTEEPEQEPPATVVAASAESVRRITVESGDRRVELARTASGSWSGAAGASPALDALMSDIEERLFPLRAYRAVAADPSSPEYGLTRPEITFRVEETGGRTSEVALGAPTFTNGGVYARRSSEAGRLYLVPRRMMDDLRSLVTGRRVDAANDLPDKLREATPKHDPTSWWLRQALDAGAAPEGAPQ